MKALLVMIALAFFVFACSAETAPPQLAAPQPVSAVQPAPTPSAPPPVQVVPAAQVPPAQPSPPAMLSADGKKLQGLIDIADKKLKSYQYFYSDRRVGNPVKFPIWGNFKVKGDRIRIDITPVEEMSARLANLANSDQSLYQPQLYGDDYYDQFFLNTATQKAIARCDNVLCRKHAAIAPVNYADFYRKTPMDWRKEIPLDSVRIIDSKQIQGQSIIRVTYQQDGEPMTQWLEQYAMLPIRVDVGDEENGYTINFVDFAPNAVSDKEFEGVQI